MSDLSVGPLWVRDTLGLRITGTRGIAIEEASHAREISPSSIAAAAEAVERARFAQGAWRETPLVERLAVIRRVLRAIGDGADRLAAKVTDSKTGAVLADLPDRRVGVVEDLRSPMSLTPDLESPAQGEQGVRLIGFL